MTTEYSPKGSYPVLGYRRTPETPIEGEDRLFRRWWSKVLSSVEKVASKYSKPVCGLDREELIAQARFVLLQAIRTYDLKKQGETKFTSYYFTLLNRHYVSLLRSFNFPRFEIVGTKPVEITLLKEKNPHLERDGLDALATEKGYRVRRVARNEYSLRSCMEELREQGYSLRITDKSPKSSKPPVYMSSTDSILGSEDYGEPRTGEPRVIQQESVRLYRQNDGALDHYQILNRLETIKPVYLRRMAVLFFAEGASPKQVKRELDLDEYKFQRARAQLRMIVKALFSMDWGGT